MILGVGRATGKVILFGEHAVVYGRPALAAPVTQVYAEAIIESAAAGTGATICAADLGEEIALRDAPADHPLAAAVRLALAAIARRDATTGSVAQDGILRYGFGHPPADRAPIGQERSAGSQPITEPDWRIVVRSTIPIASGLGSGAAVSAALVRAVTAALQRPAADQPHNAPAGEAARSATNGRAMHNAQQAIAPALLSALIYEVERLHHGTPSGIDNTVIAYEQPVYFVRGQAPQTFAIGRPFTLVIADTGIRSPTKVAVGDVRRAWEQEPARCEALFDRIAALVAAARVAIAAGRPEELGPLMDENHALLQQLGVSSPELDALVAAARAAGAIGAKLSGAGRGGNMIALTAAEDAARISAGLRSAGAGRVIVTAVG